MPAQGLPPFLMQLLQQYVQQQMMQRGMQEQPKGGGGGVDPYQQPKPAHTRQPPFKIPPDQGFGPGSPWMQQFMGPGGAGGQNQGGVPIPQQPGYVPGPNQGGGGVGQSGLGRNALQGFQGGTPMPMTGGTGSFIAGAQPGMLPPGGAPSGGGLGAGGLGGMQPGSWMNALFGMLGGGGGLMQQPGRAFTGGTPNFNEQSGIQRSGY